MKTHIHATGYSSFVGVKHGNTQALWESSMETLHTRGHTRYMWESSMETRIHSGRLSLLDMSAAFDTVEHNMLGLIQRLSHSFGMKDRALSWLESYINGRTEPVHLSREETPPRPVTCGVCDWCPTRVCACCSL